MPGKIRSRSADPVSPISPETDTVSAALGNIWLHRTHSLPEIRKCQPLTSNSQNDIAAHIHVNDTRTATPSTKRCRNAFDQIKQAIKEQLALRRSSNSNKFADNKGSSALSTARNPISSVGSPLLPFLKTDGVSTPLLNRLKNSAFNRNSQKDSSSEDLQSDKIRQSTESEAESPPKGPKPIKLPPIEIPVIRNLSALIHRHNSLKSSPSQTKRYGNLPTLSVRRHTVIQWSHRDPLYNSSDQTAR